MITARVSVASLMSALCWLTLAALMGALLLALGHNALAAIPFGVVAARGYRRTYRVEQELAKRTFDEVAARLQQ